MNFEDMSLSELQNLRNRCDYFIVRKEKGLSPVEHTEGIIEFYDKLRRVSVREGVSYFPSFEVFQRSDPKRFTKFCSGYSHVTKWFENSAFDKAYVDWLYRSMFVMLLKSLKASPSIDRVNFKMVLATVHQIPELFEKQFPDYIKLGFQNKILNGLINRSPVQVTSVSCQIKPVLIGPQN